MSEKRLVIDGLEIAYTGLFDIDGLLRTIDKVSSQLGYIKQEKRREELVRETGKEFYMELRPVKVKTDYFVLMIKIRMEMTGIKDVEVVKDNINTRLQEGKVNVLIDGWTTTDYEFRWEQKPLFYFLRNLFERFIYKFHVDRFTEELASDCHVIRDEIKAFLELHRF